eukprot:877830-Prorocentrum_lima.AAC.1
MATAGCSTRKDHECHLPTPRLPSGHRQHTHRARTHRGINEINCGSRPVQPCQTAPAHVHRRRGLQLHTGT